MKLIIELEFTGKPEDALSYANNLLDDGAIQNLINDHDEPETGVYITQASARLVKDG